MNRCIILALISIILPLTAIADEFKIATVDMARILNESPQAKQKRDELSKLSQGAKEKVEKKKSALKTMESKLKTQNVKEDSSEADQYRAQARDLSRLVKDTEDDLKRKYLSFTKGLTDNASRVIKNYADRNGIDLVLEKSATIRGPVLYGDTGYDITDVILAELSKSKS